MTLIVGIDPGKSTGLVVLHGMDKVLVFQGSSTQALHTLRSVLDARTPADPVVDIACERYVLPPGSSRRSPQPEAIEFVGRLEQLLSEYSFTTLTLQMSSDARRLMPDATLRQIGIYTPAAHVHANDANDVNSAARHALLLMMKRHFAQFSMLMQRARI